MELTDKSKEQIQRIKDILDKKDIIYKELPNGQLKVDTVNLWATKENWYDTKYKIKGQGINSFIKYLKDNEII